MASSQTIYNYLCQTCMNVKHSYKELQCNLLETCSKVCNPCVKMLAPPYRQGQAIASVNVTIDGLVDVTLTQFGVNNVALYACAVEYEQDEEVPSDV